MKDYIIFSEGYRVMEGSGKHFYHGVSKGQNFKEACFNFAKQNDDFAEYFNEERMTYWGCRLFDNAIDASKYFG